MESLLNCLSVSEIFQMLTALLAGTYFGGMLYVSIIEAQSRENLPIVSHWEQWCSGFRKAGKVMSTMAILQAVTSVGVHMSNISSGDQMIWLIPPGIMIFIILYTLIFMMKLNYSLLEKDVIKEKGGKWVKDATARWERLHRVRVVAGLASFCVVLYAIIKQN